MIKKIIDFIISLFSETIDENIISTDLHITENIYDDNLADILYRM